MKTPFLVEPPTHQIEHCTIEVAKERYPFGELARPIVYFLILGAFLSAAVLFRHGDFRSTADVLAIKPVSLVLLDVPDSHADRGSVKKISIRNLSLNEIEIFGVNANCHVNPLSSSSCKISPFGVAEIPIWIGPTEDDSKRELFVYTSLSSTPLEIGVSNVVGDAK
jgi:hypothetical protein